MLNVSYVIDGEIVIRVREYPDGGEVRDVVGNRLMSVPTESGVIIQRFEVDQYVDKETLTYLEDDDEEHTQFYALVQDRIAYWKDAA